MGKAISKLREQGIVLVTTLLTVVLVVMLVTGAVYSGINSLSLTSSFYDNEAALMAAESGIQYATTKLQNNISWCGNDTNYNASNDKSFSVKEDQGNVVGLITSPGGKQTAFRIKFNYEENGRLKEGGNSGDLDGGLENHQTNQVIPSAYVSVNNLRGSVSKNVYRTGSDGNLIESDLANMSPSYSLPRATCCLICEGFSGPALRDAGLDDIVKLTSSVTSNVTKRTVETYLTFDPEGNSLDSAACAAGNITANLADGGKFVVSCADGSGTPRIRSLNNVDVNAQNGSFLMENGEVLYGLNGNAFTFNGSQLKTISSSANGNTSAFKRLEWDDVPKATSGANNLKAGTYVWSTNEKGARCLKYYAGSYEPGKDLPEDGGTIIDLSKNSALSVNTNEMAIMFSKNVYIEASNGCSDFILRTDDSTAKYRPTVGFVPESNGSKSSILSSEGNIYIDGATLGAGAITSGGNITLQGPSLLESDPETGVSIYAKGDGNLKAITNATVLAAETANPGSTEVTTSGTGTSTTNFDSTISTTNYDLSRLTAEQYIDSIGQTVDLRPSDCSIEVTDANGNVLYTVEAHALSGSRECTCQQGSGYGYCPLHGTFTAEGLEYIHKAAVKDPSVTQHEAVKCNCCPGSMNEHFAGCQAEGVIKSLVNKYTQALEEDDLSSGTANASSIESINSIDKASEWKDYGYKCLKTKNSVKKSAYLDNLITKHGSVGYSDQDISGVIYAWGNFNVNIGTGSLLHVTGTVIAYGGNPTDAPNSNNGKGNININAKDVELEYDPTYIKELLSQSGSLLLKRTLWTSW